MKTLLIASFCLWAFLEGREIVSAARAWKEVYDGLRTED